MSKKTEDHKTDSGDSEAIVFPNATTDWGKIWTGDIIQAIPLDEEAIESISSVAQLEPHTQQDVTCPHCQHEFFITVPPMENTIVCPVCEGLCDWWADGDITPGNSYYLTKKQS